MERIVRQLKKARDRVSGPFLQGMKDTTVYLQYERLACKEE